jgi:hypothetical protein
MLDTFFKINLPYGIKRNDKDEWMAFNREYLPIGFNSGKESDNDKYNIHTCYRGLTEKLLVELADGEHRISRDPSGKIYMVFFYGTEMFTNRKALKNELFDQYFNKLKKLAALNVKL